MPELSRALHSNTLHSGNCAARSCNNSLRTCLRVRSDLLQTVNHIVMCICEINCKPITIGYLKGSRSSRKSMIVCRNSNALSTLGLWSYDATIMNKSPKQQCVCVKYIMVNHQSKASIVSQLGRGHCHLYPIYPIDIYRHVRDMFVDESSQLLACDAQ
jgi:hypothetical protein